MKSKAILLKIVLGLSILAFNSCTIEGEEICGTWNVNGDGGEMTVEITPWKGSFMGYLLEYQNGSETITGSKTKDFVLITGLEFKDGKYQKGKIYLEPNSEIQCGLELELLSDDQLKAVYHCNGQASETIWYRKGSPPPLPTARTLLTDIDEAPVAEEEILSVAPDKEREPAVQSISEELTTSLREPTTSNLPQTGGETKNHVSFYIIGASKTVKYDDEKAMKTALETLWTKAYDDGFLSKLQAVIGSNNVYVSYSNYDTPKGKVTITLGYRVKHLSSVPSEKTGIIIPANEYLVHLISEDKTGFEEEGWEQLMKYRKKDSVDFEIYTFDNNYNIKKAERWIATK